MQRDLCPHCGQHGIAAVRRLGLGPLYSARCTACGGQVGVPFKAVLASVPLFLALILAVLPEKGSLESFWLGALGTLGMLYLWFGWVPLVKHRRDSSGRFKLLRGKMGQGGKVVSRVELFAGGFLAAGILLVIIAAFSMGLKYLELEPGDQISTKDRLFLTGAIIVCVSAVALNLYVRRRSRS